MIVMESQNQENQKSKMAAMRKKYVAGVVPVVFLAAKLPVQL